MALKRHILAIKDKDFNNWSNHECEVFFSVGLAAPLQCDLCQQKEEHTTESESNLLHHYTNIPVYRKDGDVILGGGVVMFLLTNI